jgi:hypothetical protein
MVFKSNYNQVNQDFLLWRYFGNFFDISSFFGEFIFHFYFTQTQVYTLSLRGDVKNIMLSYFSFYVRLFFIFLSLSFIQTQVYTLSLRGDVKNIMLGYLLLLYVY